MNRHHNPKLAQLDLGTRIRDLAHDASAAFALARAGDGRASRGLIARVDELRHLLADRSSSELYRWLESLRRELKQAARRARTEFPLSDDEESGFFDPTPGVGVGS